MWFCDARPCGSPPSEGWQSVTGLPRMGCQNLRLAVAEDVYQGTHYWYGDLVKDTVLDLHIINQQNSLMLELADEFNADYDGWGTPILK